MSQVDYVHFFNNIIWNFGQLIFMYFGLSIIYVQSFYKILRIRLLGYNNFNNFLTNKDYFINKNFEILKEIFLKKTGILKMYKFTKNNPKKII